MRAPTLRALVPLLILTTLIACASTPPAPTGEPTALAPLPFPAARIRAATADGRTYVMRVDEEGAPAMYKRMRFQAVTDQGAELVVTQWPVDEAPPEPRPPVPVTWAALESHAHFPADKTTIADGTTEVPAGMFACRIYTVIEGDGGVTRYWFANDLPGAPVRYETTKGGAVTTRMVLVEHRPGGGP